MDRLEPWRRHLLFLLQIKLATGKKKKIFFDATLVLVEQILFVLGVKKTSGSASAEHMKLFTKNTIRQMKYRLLLKRKKDQEKL